MAFPQSFLDELIARNDIVDVVGGYVTLTSKGGSYWGCCPFHSEKTPSFHVLPDKQFYHCFGCKKGGGVINFIMDMENLSYPDAVRFLAKRVNIPVPEDEDDGSAKLRRRILELNREAARFYYDLLQKPEGAAVQAYLDKRQIRRPIAVRFGMGAAPDAWDTLLREMTARGYTKAELISAGLAVQSRNGHIYDKFRNRVMFPIINTSGKVIGFGGRVLDGSEPKYLNTPETPVFDKGRNLYGLNYAKNARTGNVIICEGYMDVIAMHSAGFTQAVASLGTALTQMQVNLLKRCAQDIVLSYDSDEAGVKAAKRAIGLIREAGLRGRVLNLAPYKDPDEFIKNEGRDAFA